LKLWMLTGPLIISGACSKGINLTEKSPFTNDCDSVVVLKEKYTHPEYGYSVMLPDTWYLEIESPDEYWTESDSGYLSGLTFSGIRVVFDSTDMITHLRAVGITHYTGKGADLMEQHQLERNGSIWNDERVSFIDEGIIDVENQRFTWTLHRDESEYGMYHGIFFLTEGSGEKEYYIIQLGFYGEDWEQELCRMQPILSSLSIH